MTHLEEPDVLQSLCTEEMFAVFWKSKSIKYRELWGTRMKSGLSPKRKFQLTRHMAEFFARQKGPMQEIAKAKRVEFQRSLDQCEADIKRFESALGNARMSREQLRGAIEGLDILFKAAGVQVATEPPRLTLVPPPIEAKPTDPVPPTPAPTEPQPTETGPA